MRGSTVMRHLRKLALALTACLGFAVVVPLYFFAERRNEDSFAISVVRAAPSYQHELAYPVRLSTTPDLTLRKAEIEFYGPGTPGGTMPQAILEEPVFRLNLARPATSPEPRSQSPDGAVSLLLRQIAVVGFELITVRRGRLEVVMRDDSVETIDDIHADVKRTGDGRITGWGNFTVRGQRLAFKATLSQPPDKAQPSRRPLHVDLGKSGLLQGVFDGYVDLGRDLQLFGQAEITTSSLRGIGRWFGLPLYRTEGFNATTIKGELMWAHGSLAFEKAHITVDGNQGNGRVVLNLSPRPTIEATLDFDRLDLTPYIEAAHVGPLAFAHTRVLGFELPAAWSSAFNVSLPMIGHLDADLRISAHEVALRDFTLGRGAATITAQAGKLHADIAELQLPSGTLSAQVTAIMTEAAPRYALRAKIEDLEMGSTSRLLPNSPVVSGKAAVTLDLTSTGHYLADVAERLSGKIALIMPEGGRMALDLEAVRGLSTEETSGWSRLTAAHTDLDRLEAHAMIIDGVVFAEDVHAHAGDIAMALTGRLGLVDGNMDVSLLLKAKHPPDEPLQATDVPDEIVTLRGAWANPHVGWMPSGP